MSTRAEYVWPDIFGSIKHVQSINPCKPGGDINAQLLTGSDNIDLRA